MDPAEIAVVPARFLSISLTSVKDRNDHHYLYRNQNTAKSFPFVPFKPFVPVLRLIFIFFLPKTSQLLAISLFFSLSFPILLVRFLRCFVLFHS